uniref:Uncharacterized protein n=1 Tax=Anguilla anguilla TaxID=7936 RepID=A0A0E9PYW9_ANGAN
MFGSSRSHSLVAISLNRDEKIKINNKIKYSCKQ